MPRPDLAQLFVDKLPVIDRVIAALSARYAMTSAASADYAARVKRAIIADDYALLASSRGEFALETYIGAVAALVHRDGVASVDPSRVDAVLYGRFTDDRLRAAFEDVETVAPEQATPATKRELATAKSGSAPPPMPSGSKGVLSVIAVVIVIAAAAFIFLRAPAGPYEPTQLAADAAASPLLAQAPAWPPRALGAIISPTGVAARIGALLVDLEATSASAATARTPAAELAHLLDGLPNGAAAAKPIHDLANGGASVPSASARRAAGTKVLKLVDRGFADAAAYLEAARLAASSGTLAFFDKHPRSALDQLRASTNDPDVRTALDHFDVEARRANKSAIALASTAEAALRLLAK